jgi:hypothetical protein
MKVRELKELLNNYDDELEIYLKNHGGESILHPEDISEESRGKCDSGGYKIYSIVTIASY